MPNLVELIRQIVSETQASSEPTDLVYGTVKSVSPLSVQIDQKTVLTSDFLVMTKNVSDYKVDMEIDGQLKKVTIKNGLKAGDKVILIKQYGGQSFLVQDKIGG